MSDAVEASAEIAKVLSPFSDLTKKLFGPMADEVGNILGDRMKEYRLKNWLAIIGRTKKMLEDAQVEAGTVPPRLMLPIIEASSVEDDPSLQDMWSGLLASASANPQSLTPAFIDTLRQMSPQDAVALRYYYHQFFKIAKAVHKPYQSVVFGDRLDPVSKLPLEGFDYVEWQGFEKISKAVLLKLGLLDRHYRVANSFGFDDRRRGGVESIELDIKPSEYGSQFLIACTGAASKAEQWFSSEFPSI